MAFGTINSIDTSAADGMPGLLGIYTSENLPLPSYVGFPLIPEELGRPPLTTSVVRFVGEPLSAVVAESRTLAEDAAEQVLVDIEPLDPLITAADALAEGAALLFPDHGSNVCFAHAFGTGEDDPDPLEGADHVAEVTMVSQRLAGVPIEPNGAFVVPDGDSITVYIPSQTPISFHEPVSGLLGMDPGNVRIIPSAAELPSFETSNTETASRRNPLGAKGIGESGTIGSTPAIHNAVVDAVSHLGVETIDMPLSPMTVWTAIQNAS